jgi:hypothetical protein
MMVTLGLDERLRLCLRLLLDAFLLCSPPYEEIGFLLQRVLFLLNLAEALIFRRNHSRLLRMLNGEERHASH